VVAFAFLALVGWRVMRRFGGLGLAVFLGILAVVGTLRDYLIAGRLMGLVEFAPGVVLAIIDGLPWAGLTALAIAVMRAVSGPARGPTRAPARRFGLTGRASEGGSAPANPTSLIPNQSFLTTRMQPAQPALCDGCLYSTRRPRLGSLPIFLKRNRRLKTWCRASWVSSAFTRAQSFSKSSV
jgi:hypothetical protein